MKNKNKYLSWACAEAAELARRADSAARAAYYMMRDGVPFMPEKAFV